MSARQDAIRYKYRPWNPQDKFTYEPIRTMDISCYHCGRMTRHILENVEDAETKEWRERHDWLLAEMNGAIDKVRAKFGTDPMSIMTQELLVRVRELLACHREGEEWKHPKNADGG